MMKLANVSWSSYFVNCIKCLFQGEGILVGINMTHKSLYFVPTPKILPHASTTELLASDPPVFLPNF